MHHLSSHCYSFPQINMIHTLLFFSSFDMYNVVSLTEQQMMEDFIFLMASILVIFPPSNTRVCVTAVLQDEGN